MINLFEDINVLDTQISNLKWKLKYSKNKDKDHEVINKLTEVRNNYNGMLRDKYYLDSLDALIFSLMLNLITEKGTPIEYNMDLQAIHRRVISVIKDGAMQKRGQLIAHLILGWEAQCLKRYEVHKDKEIFNDERTRMDEKYCDNVIRQITDQIKDAIQWTM